ncbi:uncharacterized protein LOC143021873 isoform X3 [Oratosquilla oratoria]|uniref:uncharacterized protein LOC143021873 isoform X3 n=1 Tax=Oratosquilla oratoria TaxID=337810 RepID=UPI003F776193
MVRKYQSKTDRARADGNLMERAVDEVVKGKSIREVSRLLDVNRITLSRYVKKFQAGQAKKTKDYAPKYNTRQVFTEEEEDGLAEYIVTCSQLLHGLGLTAVRRLAFDYAMKKDKTCPDSWKHNCMAGKDWMAGFMKRHCKITLHLPESTSVASVQAFNKQSVGEFFDIWTKTQAEKMFGPESVYNLDETGITTVQNVPKILATREQKQIGQTAAAERGTLITVCCCVNAVGRSLPPAMIFPRVHFKDFMTKGSPTGTLGLATQSEWMNSDLFPLVLQHFIKHMGCSTEKPAVLFMDNHESHLSLEVMEMARKHGLSIITFPPHTSHKLQPLDVSVYGPLKTHYKQAVNDWNLSSPGKRITIYDLPECFTKAYHRALSVENILAGFKKTGIWPIDTQIFSDNDFLAASVFMSRPNIDNVVNNGGDVVNPQGDLNLPSTSTASTMSTNKDSCQEEGLDHQTSFEEWTDLRKPSNQSSNQASKRKIAGAKKITSTPEKNLALMKMEEKLQKLRKTQKRLVVEDESSDEEVENTSIHGESSEYEEDFAADQTEEQSMKEECDSDNNDSSTIANENDLAGLMKEEENFEEELTIKEEPLDDREIDIRTIRKRKKRKLNSSIGRSEPKQKIWRADSVTGSPMTVDLHIKHYAFEDIFSFLTTHIYPESLVEKGKKANFRRSCKTFCIVDNKLYYKRKQKNGDPLKVQVLWNEEEVRRVIREVHESESKECQSLRAHHGITATIRLVSKRFYWRSVAADVSSYVKTCTECQRETPRLSNEALEQHSVPVPDTVMKQIGVDICTLPENDGYKYVVLAIDYFSKWTEARPLKRKDASSVAEFLYELVTRHSCFDIQINDQSREFVNQVSETLHMVTRVKLKVTCAYHPNGHVERQNRTIKDKLLEILENYNNWVSCLSGVIFAHRTALHRSTGYSPFFLLYNREPVLPVDVQYGIQIQSSASEFDEDYVVQVAEAMTFTSSVDRKGGDHSPQWNGPVKIEK